MRPEIDRVQLAVPDRKEAASGWQSLLGAEHVRDDKVACLGAQRSVYQVGSSEIEFLEPDGTGVVANSLTQRGRPHLFGAGVSTPDFDALKAHVATMGQTCIVEGDQAHLCYSEPGANDLHIVFSAGKEREPIGLLDKLYEVTILDSDFQKMTDAIAALLQLNADQFCRITSSNFKYDGYLTLFKPGELDRFEVIHPTSSETTMGRFQTRQGRAYYMSFAETPHILEIERRAKEAGAGITVSRPDGKSESEMADQLWLHPAALGGMMLGISRRTMAWSWSGSPERVVEA
jgi:hypothetical protein